MSSAAPPTKRRALSPAQRSAAQRTFQLFTLFNVCAFQCLSGNLITLYGLRMGLGTVMLGALFAVIPLSQFMPIIGRLFVNRFGNVRSMGVFWTARFIMAAPLLVVALFAGAGQTSVAVALLFIGVLGFNLARGAGMTGMQPVIGHLTTPQDRGLFMSRMQLIIHGVIVVTGLLMGLILDRESPLVVYTIIMAVGVVSGGIATLYVVRLPEPPREERAGPLLGAAVGALRDATMRRFLILILAVFAGSFMVGPFFIVFLRQVYGMGDDAIMLVTVIGSFGAICMALLSGLMTDRIGAQPLLVVSACVMAAVMLPLVVAPPLPATAAWAYGAAVFFLFMLGTSGLQSASTVYFLSICKVEERLNVGILYLMATGLGGTLGSLAGGALLDLLGRGLGVTGSFRAYFAVLTVLFAAVGIGMGRAGAAGRLPGARRAVDDLLHPRPARAGVAQPAATGPQPVRGGASHPGARFVALARYRPGSAAQAVLTAVRRTRRGADSAQHRGHSRGPGPGADHRGVRAPLHHRLPCRRVGRQEGRHRGDPPPCGRALAPATSSWPARRWWPWRGSATGRVWRRSSRSWPTPRTRG